MFYRNIIKELSNWASKPERKPLVLRGARQVGKTSVVNLFGQQFEQYIYLNLELKKEKNLFEEYSDIETLVQKIFLAKKKQLTKKSKTLIFIDEIQEVPKALNILRYFYELEPEIAVIAAGSLLETIFNQNVSFPVGRVEFMVLRPVTFPEFLGACGEIQALNILQEIPLKNFAHDRLLELFHTYVLIGGMPEIINNYLKYRDLTRLSSIFDGLINTYLDDVEKYADTHSQVQHIRFAISHSFSEANNRIKFEGFGGSTYKSRDMGEALRTLEKAFLLNLIYPCTSGELPLSPDIKKSPRLQVLDTGMLNYFVGIQYDLLGKIDLQDVYKGAVIEHIVGQELLATQFFALNKLNFWVREKKTSQAEIDYIYLYKSKLIPIEVKSGATGTLKSLQLYMDQTPHNLAIRYYAGELKITKMTTVQGKEFNLLSLPYYLVSKIDHYLDWFETQI